MPLIERDVFMTSLYEHFENVAGGEGHCILLSGEAGFGKSVLVKAFCKDQRDNCTIYQGACDDLFTPRPLAPLYDVLWQVNKERWPVAPTGEERSVLFADFFQELSTKKGRLLIVFEDIHWADEGTLDFIKFFVRRIDQLQCLFILTYRENEIHSQHPLRSVLGQLPPDSFTKLVLTPLSKQAVVEMASKKGYNGEDVYSISRGNPFYVNEILASYSPGVPDNIKDSILAVYERQKEGTKNAWQIWSVIPEGLEIERLAKIKSALGEAIEHCFAISVIIVEKGKVVFKHELYRRTIEESLTPSRRIEISKMMLELFLESFEDKGEIERILHYAKNANERSLVVRYAPEVARKAASIGAHNEAAKLYFTAIECFEGNDARQLASLHEAYAYECYLSNQIKEAITFTEKALNAWKETEDINRTIDSLRFLSRLWWFEGIRKKADDFALQAIELTTDQPPSSTIAMAFSNMSQLKMLSDEPDECMLWTDKAIKVADQLGDKEVLAHALNNMGTVQMLLPGREENGVATLQQSLQIALAHSYQEHVARAYTNLASSFIKNKKYSSAKNALEEGFKYCEARDLYSWSSYMLSLEGRMKLEMGDWAGAKEIADSLVKTENQVPVIKIFALIVEARIRIRTGIEVRPLALVMKDLSFPTMELQRIIPAMVTLLEYEWLTGTPIINDADITQVSALMRTCGNELEKGEFSFWMKLAGRHLNQVKEIPEPYDTTNPIQLSKAASFWERVGCPYEQAIVLFLGNDEHKRKAIALVQALGATAVYEKMKKEMKTLGIKNIPRGIRESTRSNAALLTGREMDILKLLKQDLHNKEIAAQLYISAKTVDHHVSSILFKLDATSRSKAVAQAVRLGIIK